MLGPWTLTLQQTFEDSVTLSLLDSTPPVEQKTMRRFGNRTFSFVYDEVDVPHRRIDYGCHRKSLYVTYRPTSRSRWTAEATFLVPLYLVRPSGLDAGSSLSFISNLCANLCATQDSQCPNVPFLLSHTLFSTLSKPSHWLGTSTLVSSTTIIETFCRPGHLRSFRIPRH